jgi:hypothetical protein
MLLAAPTSSRRADCGACHGAGLGSPTTVQQLEYGKARRTVRELTSEEFQIRLTRYQNEKGADLKRC